MVYGCWKNEIPAKETAGTRGTGKGALRSCNASKGSSGCLSYFHKREKLEILRFLYPTQTIVLVVGITSMELGKELRKVG